MLSESHIFFLPRMPGRHEDDLIEVETLCHFTRGNQVAVMDRIERSTHHANTRPTHSHDASVAQWPP